MAHRCTSMIKNGPSMYRLKQAHPSMYRIFEKKKKGPIDVPGSLILRPMFAAHPYNHFCTEYPPPGFYFYHVYCSNQNCHQKVKLCSLLLPGGQDKNISSIFPHFPEGSPGRVSHFSSYFLHLLPHFGLSSGWLAYSGRLWLSHWKWSHTFTKILKCDISNPNHELLNGCILIDLIL